MLRLTALFSGAQLVDVLDVLLTFVEAMTEEIRCVNACAHVCC
jgi:hypothetical protein